MTGETEERNDFDFSRLTLDDLCAVEEMEEAGFSARGIRALLQKVAVGFEPGELTVDELNRVNELMTARLKEAQAAAVPPASGGD